MKSSLLFVGAASAFAAVALVVAGDLNPPPGAPSPTPGPEPRTAINATNTPGDADSLFKITQPGSYYLTGNITGEIGKHGIEIAASGVTLDLMGFNLQGVVDSSSGAFVSDLVTDIAVLNGSLRGWGYRGVDMDVAANTRLANLRVSGNADAGIVAGDSAVVTDCTAYQNGHDGIRVGANCTVSDCTARENDSDGIDTSSGCTIIGCSAVQNNTDGIEAGPGSTIIDCAAYANGDDGILASPGCTIRGCTAKDNTGDGISADNGCTIASCSASNNTGNGIDASTGSTIASCSAAFNALDGIRAHTLSMVLGNTCASNGTGGDGAGIHATGIYSRIEGNNCTDSDRGIDVDLARNMIIRNTCAGNTTNWDIAANNYYGSINNRVGIATAAVNGDSAAGTLNSTDPHANFTY